MLVVNCRNPNSAERETLASLSKLQGVAIVGYTVLQETKEREIDIILITPVRAVAIEVKAPKSGTATDGELIPTTNGAWRIGEQTASFYGGSNPLNQARTSAKILASFLKDKVDGTTPFIQVAVSISGESRGLTMERPLLAGLTAVAFAGSINEGLDLMRKKPISFDMVEKILDAMGLGVLRPSSDRVKKEWSGADAVHKELTKIRKPTPSELKKEKQFQMFSPFYYSVERVSELLNTAIVTFLLVWFLCTTGILDYVVYIFDNFSLWLEQFALK